MMTLNQFGKYISAITEDEYNPQKIQLTANPFRKIYRMRGNFSTNYQVTGRELMTPDEVRMLDNRYEIVFIRGERPIMDDKYNILGHPNISLGHDGGADAYDHGKIEIDSLGFEIVKASDYTAEQIQQFPVIHEELDGYEALDDVEVDALIEFINEEKQKSKNKETETNEK